MSDAITIDEMRAKTLVSALQGVRERVGKVAGGRDVRIVAVSKLKPPADILALYEGAQQTHFGENYAQELMEKAEMLPKEIQWHFIGGLQSNKCKPLSSTLPNLHTVSSIDTPKKATQLNLGRATSFPNLPPLNIHIQLNTSSEPSKSGVAPGSEALSLSRHILQNCPHLKLAGLMTIGAIARSKATGEENGDENEDFRVLREERDRLEKELEVKLELSMGMSGDFEGAVRMGSAEVRVGSTVFGDRPPKEEFRVKGNGNE